ncbi:STAS/SEC14 domain-containing protein [Sulfitobacter aestuariivivens]|uniref:STAS/SEC14 domain-containing protein n=1 Tax=Sulfitobacter aestuariivivens TaxID=2766981 RepID=A0A927D653_9RHOB|nr:STAS/SEC14 domain-containing protein [Sulfitobacter aestuariivivens]MBD3665106.1 STAS/SEC14 domain-containing protein [Sulfitobacter aestuariivivens]
MIEINKFAPRAVEMKVRGPIEQNDIEKLESALDPYLPDEGSISAVIDITDTDRDLVNKPAHLDRLLAQIDKFARIAVVTHDRAVSGIVSAVDALMPAGSLQQFEPARVSKARDFAAHLNRPDGPLPPAE